MNLLFATRWIKGGLTEVAFHHADTFQHGPASFAVNGCVGSIEAWLLNGRKESPDRMAAMLWDAVRAIRMAASTRGQETK